MFAHGFAIRFGQIEPPAGVDVGMVAPKGPGHLVRRQYEEGKRRSLPDGRPRGRHRQGARPGPRLRQRHRRRPRRRHRDDLQGRVRDRPVRRAGRPLRRRQRAGPAGFETLVEAGYDPRLAYFECLHELKLIVDLMYEKGIQGMRYSISNTAEYGDMTRGPKVITDDTREAMRDPRRDPVGEFAKEWIAENRAGGENFDRMRQRPRPPDRKGRRQPARR